MMAKKQPPKPNERLSTGISGLDEILHGGLRPKGCFLARGGPGCGKTTLGLHFLAAGVDVGEKALFITLGEPESQIKANAATLGLDVKGIDFLDLSPTTEFFSQAESYDIFAPAEVEREPTTARLIETVEKIKPQRVVIDSMTQFRYLATDPFQFRKQVLSFLRYLGEQGATVLFASEHSEIAPDDDLKFLADGIINLEHGPEGNKIGVTKYRGSSFRSGRHSMRISDTGIEVFPRIAPGGFGQPFSAEQISSGVPALDALTHGGLERGTVTIISGPSGVGKTTLGTAFMKEAAGRGERSVLFTFEEAHETILHRCEQINIPARDMVERGTLSLIDVEPLEYTGDQFAALVRSEVEEKKARIVMIDSVSGFRLAMKDEEFTSRIHALCRYMRNMGVTVVLVNEMESITGDFRATEIGISYLADNIVFLRYLEMRGELRKAIGVLKKRVSSFERTLREIDIGRYGITVGEPLTGLSGILRGEPDWTEGEEQTHGQQKQT